MADIFGVVADSTRREILRILLERYNQSNTAGGELSVSDIVDKLGLVDVGAYFPHRVTMHPTCHSTRLLGVGS